MHQVGATNVDISRRSDALINKNYFFLNLMEFFEVKIWSDFYKKLINRLYCAYLYFMISVKSFVAVSNTHQNNLADIFWKLKWSFRIHFPVAQKGAAPTELWKGKGLSTNKFLQKVGSEVCIFPVSIFERFR